MADLGVTHGELQPDMVVRGALFPEPVRIIKTTPMGSFVKVIGEGVLTGDLVQATLSPEQIAGLETSSGQTPFDGDAARFRLGVEALRLQLAYEYDPFFTLSIARVDPLPHQLEAVYDYFLKLPRIRFLLADDPGAGKTIMAGLLIKELKVRGLIKRTLIVTPANLTFQWQREMKDKFSEDFEIVRGDVLRATYGTNPWQDKNQVITSVSWVSVVEDARESLLRSHWDLVVVDEAHRMSARSADHRTLAYRLGESLSEMTDHYLLMTATPHKGDPAAFSMFLSLLDPDVYGDVTSLEEAVRRHHAPFYLRRVKEAMVKFPDPVTGEVKKVFTQRHVQTADFQIGQDEYDFYSDLTDYVQNQSVKAAADNSSRGRALGFTMAMLQRRFASSTRAVRMSLQRMQERREKILADPEAYMRQQIEARLPDDFDEMTDEEQRQLEEQLEGIVVSVDPVSLQLEIAELDRLAEQALDLERREVETKLVRLRELIAEQGVFANPTMKLLIFTEHKETLDFLVEKLRSWGLSVTQIHGGMKIGDRDTLGSRIYAEREFRETCQVLVATEAAGEGINLQFCWLMINYDIPWNPVRLEQRMGRIHRYGQEKDCLIFNFVSTNTAEGRVLQKLFDRLRQIEDDLDPQRTGSIFNVLGDIFPANQLEGLVRQMYQRNLTEQVILDRIVDAVDPERFRRITQSALEGLAVRQLNLSSIVGKSEEAKERRLVPEVIEDFFVRAAPLAGILPRETRAGDHVYRVGRLPRTLDPVAARLEPRFGRLGREYQRIVFDKGLLEKDATLEWVTPGHPLFECVREETRQQTGDDLQRGAIFYDLNRAEPAVLDVFSAEIRDGRGHTLHQRLFVVETACDGSMKVRQPTLFLDLMAAPAGTAAPAGLEPAPTEAAEEALVAASLQPFLEEVRSRRSGEITTIAEHLEISLNTLIDRQAVRFGELEGRRQVGDPDPLLAANLKTTEDRLDELNGRLERRRSELDQEAQCSIAGVRHHGRAWVLPHPERNSPQIRPMVRDDEIERLAVAAVEAYELGQGRQTESVERDNRGFDLISRRPHPEDVKTAIEVRFIEVKGRAGVEPVALSPNEHRTAERLGEDYWLYVVYNCSTKPEVHVIRNPARLQWRPLVSVEHYLADAAQILEASE